MTNEIWKDIKGYEGVYQVSTTGRVKSLARLIKKEKGTWNLKERILVANVDCLGYHRAGFSQRKQRKYFGIHRLVAEAFIPNPDNKKEVNHIDGNKSNNHVNNLEWATRSENMKHAVDNGLVTHLKKSSDNKKKKIYQFNRRGELIKVFNSLGEASEETGVSKAYISQLCSGTRKVQKHHEFIFSHKYWLFAVEVTE